MRFHCFVCGKPVAGLLPDEVVITMPRIVLRAILICPECIEAERVIFPEPDDDTKQIMRLRFPDPADGVL